VLPEGEWPGVVSAIAIGHDTDWSLGRYFGTGPMALLRGADGPANKLGEVGLMPQPPNTRFADVPLYWWPSADSKIPFLDRKLPRMRDWIVKQVR